MLLFSLTLFTVALAVIGLAAGRGLCRLDDVVQVVETAGRSDAGAAPSHSALQPA